jgi:sterol desaturase/sphingolipid hydroxylase (fatty acid hydroxylase superfamily)
MSLLANEASLRLAVFAAVLIALLIAQLRWPFRGDGRDWRRALRNAGLVAAGTLLLRVAFPLLAVAFAIEVASQDRGLFARIEAAPWLEWLLAVVLLDLAIYWQHRLFHAIPWAWRLHRVHHSDLRFDVTTGLRFHPFELAASMAIKLGLIWLLAPPPTAVLAFEILLSAGALFTHADIALPPAVDRRLRWLLVTPSMHRVHHSVLREETDSNYGFHLSIWDRLFRSYRAQSARPERTMPIGVGLYTEPRQQTLPALLIQPFDGGPVRQEASDA